MELMKNEVREREREKYVIEDESYEKCKKNERNENWDVEMEKLKSVIRNCGKHNYTKNEWEGKDFKKSQNVLKRIQRPRSECYP